MAEQVIGRLLDNKHKWSIPMDRDLFYREQIDAFQQTWSPTMAVSIIDAFLFNESWEIVIQKRAKHKNHNPWLLDKAIGWHIKYGDPVDYTVMIETVEELQCPSIVFKEDEDFEERLNLLSDYLTTIAVMTHIDTDVIMMEKEMKEWTITIANKKYLYFGVYWGKMKNVDKEAMWILYYDFDDLLEEMEQFPAMFTYDLKYYVQKYEKDIRSFIAIIDRLKG